MSMTLKCLAFADGQPIPKKFTGEGEDVSPALEWTDPPEGTQELVLICDDPDAPTAEPWVHWLIYGLAANVNGLPEGMPTASELSSPVHALQGQNSWEDGETTGYRGPLPPVGHGLHHYYFHLYALREKSGLVAGSDKHAVLQAIAGKVLAEAQIVGTYQR